MDIPFCCPCGHSLSITEEQAGQRMTCPKCGGALSAPTPPTQRGPTIRIDERELAPAAQVHSASHHASTRAVLRAPTEPPNQSSPQAMKANRRFVGKICPICQASIQFGEHIRICKHCVLPFHQVCWDENSGCGTYGCEGARASGPKESYADFSVSASHLSVHENPYQEGASRQGQPPLLPGTYREGEPAHACQATASYYTRYSGMAVASVVFGLLFLYGVGSVLAVILGHLAIAEINKSQGHTTGRVMAVAGLVLGYMGLAGTALVLLSIIVNSSP